LPSAAAAELAIPSTATHQRILDLMLLLLDAFTPTHVALGLDGSFENDSREHFTMPAGKAAGATV